jgi:hypothetical protein
MAKLIFINPEHAAQVYELTLEKTTVGRAAGNTLVIPDGSLSAQHCEIHVNGPEVIVRDLGSRNGTFVNGAKLTNQRSQLKTSASPKRRRAAWCAALLMNRPEEERMLASRWILRRPRLDPNALQNERSLKSMDITFGRQD